MEKLPAIEEIGQRIEILEADIVSEMPLIEDAKVRVTALRGLREDLMQQLEACRTNLKNEEVHYKRLALEVQKRQFRGTLTQGRRLILK